MALTVRSVEVYLAHRRGSKEMALARLAKSCSAFVTLRSNTGLRVATAWPQGSSALLGRERKRITRSSQSHPHQSQASQKKVDPPPPSTQRAMILNRRQDTLEVQGVVNIYPTASHTPSPGVIDG